MAIFNKKIRKVDAANLDVSLTAIVEHVTYMQTQIENYVTTLEKENLALEKRVEELEGMTSGT